MALLHVNLRRNTRILLSLLLASVLAGTATAEAQPGGPRGGRNDLQAFPQPEPGQVRRVIRLARERDEDGLRVGLVVGRTMLVDCNRHIFPARIEERTAQGWGYTYYVVTSGGQPAGTLMACPTPARTREFVRAADEPLLRYNSRVPLVVFAPRDVEVRYRIWRAGAETVAR